MSKSKGRVTIPSDESIAEVSKEIALKWGADALRDCDGVCLPHNAKEIAPKIYKTYFVCRGDNNWADKHPEEAHRVFLESKRVTSSGDSLSIDAMEGYLKDQFALDEESLSRWMVIDRDTGEEVKDFSCKDGIVTFKTIPFHRYSVDFYARLLWHPTQIYNYITNSWTCAKEKVYDPSFPATREYVKEHLRKWCEENPDINVVRFTTFFYQFSLVFNNLGKEKTVDWFGYMYTASPYLLEGFEKETGIALNAEDFVDNGRYNSPLKTPSERYRLYMDYVSRFVASLAKELVDIVHSYGKEAMMFLGDDWIGTEPYGKYFPSIGLDSVVGSIGGGVTVAMLSDIPGVKVHEGRFLPYFFPDTFFEGNEANAIAELNKNWRSARRALLRRPLERMGFGGYLSLVLPFENFVNRVGEITQEFRDIYDASNGVAPKSFLKVAVLNEWGKLRSWQSHMVAHELWYQSLYSYQGLLESLSGLPVEVEFISFKDVLDGIPNDIDVIVNAGSSFTAFSGDEAWKNKELVSKIRSFVASGHGFIGIGEPSAKEDKGSFFTLSDVLGVEKELGQTLCEDKYNIEKKSHFITEDVVGEIDYGEGTKNVYALEGTDVLDIVFSPRFKRKVNVGEVLLSANSYFKGRGVYFAGLPYGNQNSRLLYRALLWSTHKESELHKAFSSNQDTECAYYPSKAMYALINNSSLPQKTTFFDINGKATSVELGPDETRWVKDNG